MLEPPLPFGSAAGRVYYALMKGLAERGHDVTAFATCSKPEEAATARIASAESVYDLRCYPHPRRSGLLSRVDSLRKPFSYMFSEDLQRDLARELDAGFDILHLEQLLSGWLGLNHIDRSLISVHYLSSIDLAERRGNLSDELYRRLMLRTERQLISKFKFFRAVSPRIAEAVRITNRSADVRPVTIGFDVSLYPYVPDRRRPRSPTVTLIGSMGWYPTLSAAVRMLTKLYPELVRRVPGVRFQIVGWGARSALRQFLGMEAVEVLENVPETAPFFENASVLLYAPSHGSGVKIKVFEAMAFGVPVVTTNEGIEGLPVTDGVEAAVADDDEGLIDRTVALLGDRRLQNRRRRAAREMLEVCCRPSRAAQSLEEIYERMLRGSSSQAAMSGEDAARRATQ